MVGMFARRGLVWLLILSLVACASAPRVPHAPTEQLPYQVKYKIAQDAAAQRMRISAADMNRLRAASSDIPECMTILDAPDRLHMAQLLQYAASVTRGDREAQRRLADQQDEIEKLDQLARRDLEIMTSIDGWLLNREAISRFVVDPENLEPVTKVCKGILAMPLGRQFQVVARGWVSFQDYERRLAERGDPQARAAYAIASSTSAFDVQKRFQANNGMGVDALALILGALLVGSLFVNSGPSVTAPDCYNRQVDALSQFSADGRRENGSLYRNERHCD